MISVTDPISPAIAWTERVLFQPFQMEKWFVLGFCAFLANLGGGGFNYRGGNLFRNGHGLDSGPFEEIGGWISAHHLLAFSIIGTVVVLGLALGILFLWLSSRGQFMFLDGVVHNRAAVSEPWHRFRDLGNQLFRFRLVLLFASLLILAVMGGGGVWMYLSGPWADHRNAVPLLVFGGVALVILLAILFGFLVVSLLLHDFVVPIMYLRGVDVREGFRILRREILPGHGGTFVLFYLMKLVLGIAAGVLILLGICLTCCIALLPYLSSVVFLPVFVFFRSYSLRFLEQFGEAWRLIGREATPQPEAQPGPLS